MSGPPAFVPPERMQDADRGPELFEALDAHLRRRPEAPALFHPEGLDVRWRSWRALADQTAGGAEALAAAGLGAGDRVGYRSRCHPDAVAADLAVLGIDGVAVPVTAPGEAASAGCAAWMALPGEEPPRWGAAPQLPLLALPEARPSWARRPGAGRFPTGTLGGARVVDPGPSGGADPAEREVTAAETVRAARELGARIAAAAAEAGAAAGGDPRTGREIAVVHLDLGALDGRVLLSWALGVGAALYLEPDPRAVPGSAAWARPTLVAAEAQPLVELARQLRRRDEGRLRKLRRGSRPRRPFGRLRLLVVLGGGRLPVGDLPFWAERGVVVLRG